ncbi:MAG TPA: DinB family protein, partial [Anseongella sp.]|nr:DinB family protein [Anseongella sp.]
EHIVISDKSMFEMVRKLVEQPANPERKGEIKTTDQEIIGMMSDRSKKAQAPESGRPKGVYANTKDALADFKKQRKEITEYIRNTPENLRDHITDSPGGPVDAHHFLLYIAAHGARHTQQIEEVKASPGFPAGK